MAQLYFQEKQLFSKIIGLNSTVAIYEIFNVSVAEYWKSHYQFDKESPKKRKPLTKSFIDLLIINTIVPVQFAYAKSQSKENFMDILAILNEVSPEKNATIDKFTSFGILPKNAFETQSLLQLKNEYCSKNRCLECSIGAELLKSN